MTSWIVISWILFVYVAYLSLISAYGCEIGWFGTRCQYKCRCSENRCTADGLCKSDSTCSKGWFGPACQYVDMATSVTAVKGGQALATVTDSNDYTCLNQITTRLTVVFKLAFHFTWLRVHVSKHSSRDKFKIQFKNGSALIPCTNPRSTVVSATALDIHCNLGTAFTALSLSGRGVHDLCTLHISGGRNVALRETTSQSSTLFTPPYSTVSSNAVDGKTDSVISKGSCSSTDLYDKKPNLNLTFTHPVILNRVLLYAKKDKCPYKPSVTPRFIIRGFNVDNKELYRSSDNVLHPNYVHSVHLPILLLGVVRINIEDLTINNIDNYRYLAVCELEVYGDSVCPLGKFGRDCQHKCKCADTSEQCFVSTGGCPSGCASGFTGEGCEQRICTAGHFGQECKRKCKCKNKKDPCDVITGECKSDCAANVTGDGCQQRSCLPGHFGQDCELKCNCAKKKEPCNVITGECFSGCAAHFTGEGCQQRFCQPGHFGQGCKRKCNCANQKENCDVITGECLSGCAAYFTGEGCQKRSCPHGYFGQICEYKCNCANKKERCNVDTGGCTSGCAVDFTGEGCQDRLCQPGHFGQGCKRKCNCANKKENCNVTTGECLSGCAAHFTGEGCQTRSCSPDRFGQNCEYKCNCANTKERCNVDTGGCTSGCAVDFTGEGCQDRRCPAEWFGSKCQYKCHCTDNKCDINQGHCVKGAKCQRGWFGPACQYSDLATSDTVVKGDRALTIVTDGDENTCLDQATKQITVTWNIPYHFTWFRVHVKDHKFLKDLSVHFTNASNSKTSLCTNRSEARISATAMDVYCDMSVTVTQVIITGQGVQSLCSLHISGGRNVALKQKASQSSYLGNHNQSKPSNAVDGSINGNFSENSCAHTDESDRQPRWNVTFPGDVAVNRYVLYNRLSNRVVMRRLRGFILTSFNRSGQMTFRYTDATKIAESKYTITTVTGPNKVAMTSIQATMVDTKGYIFLSLCEVEIYGDSVCGPGLYGRECENKCHCAVKKESCFVSTGGCPSGCAPGYSGEGCNKYQSGDGYRI